MIDPDHPRLSIVRQCELASISRASFYREPAGEREENLVLMRLIDEAFLDCPFYGARQMMRHLRRLGWKAGHKRVRARSASPRSIKRQKPARRIHDTRSTRICCGI
jgi:putative transposase